MFIDYFHVTISNSMVGKWCLCSRYLLFYDEQILNLHETIDVTYPVFLKETMAFQTGWAFDLPSDIKRNLNSLNRGTTYVYTLI